MEIIKGRIGRVTPDGATCMVRFNKPHQGVKFGVALLSGEPGSITNLREFLEENEGRIQEGMEVAVDDTQLSRLGDSYTIHKFLLKADLVVG